MVADSSGLVAIFRREPDSAVFERKIYESNGALLSSVSYVEVCMVIAGTTNDRLLPSLDQMLVRMGIQFVDVTFEDAILARQAFLHYGKGRHPAALNFGDCFSYALAKRLNEPLLFKGNDFSLTDVVQA